MLAAHAAGTQLSNTSKGDEREIFVSQFLQKIFPSKHRVGCGDIVDRGGLQSGQVDIVLEVESSPSFPVPIGDGPRIYLAEGVGAVIEVKSNLEKQWAEVVATTQKVKALAPHRKPLQKRGGLVTSKPFEDNSPLPVFAVGFDGWTQLTTLKQKVDGSLLDGALILKHDLCVVTHPESRGTPIEADSQSLWAFTMAVYDALSLSQLSVLDRWNDYA